MFSVSFLLLLGAATIVAVMHSVLPDHWIPLAVVARTQRWTISRVIRVTFLASFGHVFFSLVLAGGIAIVGLQFQKEIDAQQGHIVGAVLLFTGILFLFLTMIGRGVHGHSHSHDGHHDHTHHDHAHTHTHHHHDHAHTHHDHLHSANYEQSLVRRLAAIAIPFGVAASPDLTILPVALAASALGATAVISVLSMFTLMTIATFISLTVIATLAGYRIKGDWLEKHASAITSIVLIGLGLMTFVGF